MSLVSRTMSWLRALLQPRDADRELQREIAAHVAMEQEHLERAGLPNAEAYRQAMIAFGGIERQKEAVRDERGTRYISDLYQDLRYAARRLRRAPRVAAIIVATLAVVIGANTTIFGVIRALFLRQLALPNPSALVAVRPMSGGRSVVVTYPEFTELRRQPDLPPMAGYFFVPMEVGVAQGGALVYGDAVTGDYFALLGVRPMLGRLIMPADEAAAAPVAVVSAAFWADHLGADSALIGRFIRVNGRPFTLVGVTAPSYMGLYLAHDFDIAIPITTAPVVSSDRLSQHYLDMVARLPSGMSPWRAAFMVQSSLVSCCQHPTPIGQFDATGPVQTRTPDDPPYGDSRIASPDPRPHVELPTASRGLTWSTDFRSEYKKVLLAMVAGAGILTLIACANIATLLLARASARSAELSIRASLGASRARLVRQLFAESMVLGCSGAALGVLIARTATMRLADHLPWSAARLHAAVLWHLDPTILLFTAAITVTCVFVFGIWPARRTTQPDLLAGISGSRAYRAAARLWAPGRALVVGQLSLALVLTASAALFVATLRNLTRHDETYASSQVVLAEVRFMHGPPDSAHAASVHQRLIAALKATPGVTDVAAAVSMPAFPVSYTGSKARIPGFDGPHGDVVDVGFDAVDPGFFTATAVRITRGRAFNEGDILGATPVAIASGSFAQHYFGSQNVIGKTVTFLTDTLHPVRIVGIATEAKYRGLRDPTEEMLYLPMEQVSHPIDVFGLVVSVSGQPSAMVQAIRARLGQVAPDLGVLKVTSLTDYVDGALARERVIAWLASAFGLTALGLAAVGLYGLLAWQATQRTHEIGVRVALGAAPADAVWLVVRQTLGIAGVATAIGVPLAFGLAQAVRSQLYGIDAADPRLLAASAFVLLLVALLAGLVPARRAAHVEPMVALRCE